MSMSTHVIGFKPPDEKWEKMKAVYDLCKIAGVHTPKEVDEFFEHSTPDDSGVRVNIKAHSYSDQHLVRDGFDVHIDELPKDVKIIRFYNSW